MNKSNILGSLSDRAKEILAEQLPVIQKMVTDKAMTFVKTHGLNYLQDNEKLKPLFETTYQALPLPIRLLVRQDTFIQFCLSKKDFLLEGYLPKPEKKVDIRVQSGSTITPQKIQAKVPTVKTPKKPG